MRIYWILGMLFLWLQSCGVSKDAATAGKKYSPAQLQKDYNIFETMLEQSHPGLYWYTPKDSMDYFFKWGNAQIKDSMNEQEFKQVLNYVAAKINCGHTSILSSRKSERAGTDSIRSRIFPLSLKLWSDTMVVVANLNRKDSLLKRGTVIKSINDKSFHELVDTFSKFIPSDGFNLTHKLQALSNRSGFGTAYRNIYGLPKTFNIVFLNSAGEEKTTTIPVFVDTRDSTKKAIAEKQKRPAGRESKKEQRLAIRNLKIDSLNNVATMELNSFGRNYRLKKFFRRSFKLLGKQKVGNLIIDVRGNGGGSVSNSTLLSRYISSTSFKIADSLYAIKRNSYYGRYIDDYFLNNLFMVMMTRKKKDGNYHFNYFEKHRFQPKTRYHYDRKVYILTGGNSFSATTLFAHVLKNQDNVTILGEETGGGAYGNTAWLIPEVKLPNTKIKFRLPLFRLVIDKDQPKNGRGVLPDIEVLPTVDAIRNSVDYKMAKALELIEQDKRKTVKIQQENTGKENNREP